jgi:hypothetical protein
VAPDRDPQSLRPLDADRKVEGVRQSSRNSCAEFRSEQYARRRPAPQRRKHHGLRNKRLEHNTGPIHFTNVRILDATGEYSYTGEVVIQGNRIKQITRGSSRLAPTTGTLGGTVIDGLGATLMPGLIDAHLHLSWNNAPGIDPIQMMELEEHMLVTMEMAKLVLDAGFTAGRGAAAAKPRLDVVAKRFINEGRFPGPRYLAAGPEITTVGGLGDSAPSHIPHEGLNLGIVVSGPEEVHAACASSSNTASIPSSSISPARRSPAWAPKKRRCRKKRSRWR